MFWRSIVEAILIDRHMLFYGELLVSTQKVAFILVYFNDFMDTEVFTYVCVYDIDWGYSLEPPQ